MHLEHASLFHNPNSISTLNGVYVSSVDHQLSENQAQTNNAFSEKWTNTHQQDTDSATWKLHQFEWYMTLYGFEDEQHLQRWISKRRVILDAGCGLGYKAAWFAKMNPEAIVVAMDYSDSIFQAHERYQGQPNMIFVKGDIANTHFKDGLFDFINCDQVLHHTDSPPKTLKEFHRISSQDVYLNTYVYKKKALPRELLDEYFREYSKQLDNEQIWELSKQLTQLGKTLTDLNITIDVPDIPALGIKGGKQNLQRFFYWNFIKCFWNENLGLETSINCNFDWYSPSNAWRYSQQEFLDMLEETGFKSEYLHCEEACHSGRFVKQN
ncbi:class I SAM-dependent methyltransferase [Adonisia turfae]|uniref:Class I SAM-dependent methyltransferase n=1 Tax=Adonisia turfae CCMR0081 TaxID=2292702 RepID=A0A6M0RSX7_9CYAN|nr:class I SAM-dependent methyltransferase [Adonisia turfae]NEZ58821.1 class I SAM-dependent methyltransferase [Adonisia turfae CCMR0081]